jgi:hypothetical protein
VLAVSTTSASRRSAAIDRDARPRAGAAGQLATRACRGVSTGLVAAAADVTFADEVVSAASWKRWLAEPFALGRACAAGLAWPPHAPTAPS